VPPVNETLWRDYRARLFAFVLKRVAGDAATAEDIVHDVLLRAYEKRGTLRGEDRFESWLFRITRNALVDHYRARRPTEPLPPELASEDPVDRRAMRELAACVQPLVNALPAHYRGALALSEFEGLTQRETAARLGLSVSGAKSRVQRGRRLLQEALLDCCRVERDSRGAIVGYQRQRGGGPAGATDRRGAGGAEDAGGGCGDC
jgi:RNA polymerase sigma-70 factor, ECF subfamily